MRKKRTVPGRLTRRRTFFPACRAMAAFLLIGACFLSSCGGPDVPPGEVVDALVVASVGNAGKGEEGWFFDTAAPGGTAACPSAELPVQLFGAGADMSVIRSYAGWISAESPAPPEKTSAASHRHTEFIVLRCYAASDTRVAVRFLQKRLDALRAAGAIGKEGGGIFVSGRYVALLVCENPDHAGQVFRRSV